jgi:hypothetical protein
VGGWVGGWVFFCGGDGLVISLVAAPPHTHTHTHIHSSIHLVVHQTHRAHAPLLPLHETAAQPVAPLVLPEEEKKDKKMEKEGGGRDAWSVSASGLGDVDK